VKTLAIAISFLLITGCMDREPRSLTAAQKNAIQERIKPFSVVNVAGQGITQVAAIEELPGKSKYAGCSGCHGANGGGGVGPMLAGKGVQYIVDRLTAYKAGETVGSQSNLMWAQAGMLSDTDITDLADYIETL